MKKVTLLVLFLIAAITQSSAQTVSIDDALSKASSLRDNGARRISGTSGSTLTPKLIYTKVDKGSTLFYVFNYPQGGFAIIGGDEKANEVLGYSENGSFDIDNIPDGLRFMLECYSNDIKRAIADPSLVVPNSIRRAPAKAATKQAIAPLMSTTWDQDKPYNNLCPIYSGSTHCATGCNATASAQVMKYYNWPTTGTGSHTNATNSSLTVNFGSTTYDWANMLNDYSGSYSTTQGNAVATLMYHVGVAMDMKYGKESSSGPNQGGMSLTNYFKYAKNARYVQRYCYTNDEWENLIYNELAQNHPVQYGGETSGGGGHAFVCDGYDGNGKFHFNWGWGGYCDGDYPMTGTGALLPGGSGIGGGGEDEAYTERQDAFIGLIPDKVGTTQFVPCLFVDKSESLKFSDSSLSKSVNRAASQDNTFSMKSLTVWNYSFTTKDIVYSIMFEEQTTHKQYYASTIQTTSGFLCPQGSSIKGRGFTFSFKSADIPTNGTFKIIPVARYSDSSEWIPIGVTANTAPTITITGGASDEPVNVTYTLSESTLQVGSTAKITASAGYTGTMTFTSNKTSVATVNASGVITAVAPGTATIHVDGTATDLFKATSQDFIVTVVEKVYLSPTLVIDKTNLGVGETAQISHASGYTGTITYQSSNPAVATVSSAGVVTAIGEGTVQITANATAKGDYKAENKVFTVTVTPAFVKASAYGFENMPTIGTNGYVTSADDLKIHYRVTNNSGSTFSNAYLSYKVKVGNTTHTVCWNYGDFPANAYSEDDLDLVNETKATFTTGNEYTVYFYSDKSCTVPMNVKSLTFKYSMPGDADNNGSVNLNDVLALRNHLLGVKSANTVNSDVDFDRKITISDLIKLIKQLNNK